MFVAIVAVLYSFRYSHPLAAEVVWETYLQQPDGITCGPTSATMLLLHLGHTASIDAVKAETKTEWIRWEGKPIGMTSPEFIPKALDRFGVSAFMVQGTLSQLKHYVGQGQPCIVLLRSGTYTWHYVVVIGYDEQSIVIADPGCGCRRVLAREDFLGSWSFITDMRGEKASVQCKICNGTGQWAEGFGPLSRCEICGGTGEVTGVLNGLLKTAEVYPYTMVVPRIQKSDF